MNTNMNWAIIAELVIRYGIPLADSIITKWIANTPVTPEMWEEVRKLASQSAADRMKAKLVEAGIDLNSEQAKQLLSLTTS